MVHTPMGVLSGLPRSRFCAGQYQRDAVHPEKTLTPGWLAALAGLLWVGAALAQTAGSAVPGSEPETTGIAQSSDTPVELKVALPQARLFGKARLAMWGFQIYDARLWAPAGFDAANYGNQPLALELAYLRDFSAADIASRPIKEMRRSVAVSEVQAAQWTADLLRVIPDVKKGERILGVHRPGAGAAFWVNGKASGEIRDAEFAKLFFGIWLSPKTSQPKLREALVNGAAG